jgi:hypothetical protein
MKKEIYYQPVLTDAEWQQTWLPSFGVFARKSVAESLFPGKKIERFTGNDIEEPTYCDMEVLSRKPFKPKTGKPTMSFKDEGSYYVTKLTKDGKPADHKKMYQYGSLVEKPFGSKKEARAFAKEKGCIAVFDF